MRHGRRRLLRLGRLAVTFHPTEIRDIISEAVSEEPIVWTLAIPEVLVILNMNVLLRSSSSLLAQC